MLGLIGALTHYHSEAMECLLHTDEQHYVQNEEVFCPNCTLINTALVSHNQSFDSFLSVDVSLDDFNEVYFEKELAHPKTSRAPPVAA